MTLGPGKYDDLCTKAREKAKALGAILIVIGGERGSGFSMQVHSLAAGDITKLLPQILRDVADQIERDMK